MLPYRWITNSDIDLWRWAPSSKPGAAAAHAGSVTLWARFVCWRACRMTRGSSVASLWCRVFTMFLPRWWWRHATRQLSATNSRHGVHSAHSLTHLLISRLLVYSLGLLRQILLSYKSAPCTIFDCLILLCYIMVVGWVAEWLACWTSGSNRSRDAVG